MNDGARNGGFCDRIAFLTEDLTYVHDYKRLQ